LERRKEHLEAWRALGPPQVGRSEVDFKKAPGTKVEATAAAPVSTDGTAQ
jgi:hypothetical protein